jgi:stress-induced morphogen
MSEASGDTVVDGMVKKLEAEFSPAKLEVIPAYGDPNGSHVTITVVSKAFEGKRAVQRQQLVYKVRERMLHPSVRNCVWKLSCAHIQWGARVQIYGATDGYSGQVIWEEMQGAIHAVDQMVCKTPEEAGL